MKTALLKTTLLVTMAAVFVGCSGGNKLSSSSGTGGNSGTVLPPVDTGTGTPTTPTTTTTWPYSVGGSTAKFYPVSWEEMNSYVGIRPLNNPSDPKVNVDLHYVNGLNMVAGTVRIGYTDNNQFYYGEFSVGDGINAYCNNCYNNNNYEAAYNYTTTINGVETTMAYLQDNYGAIIIVLEKGSQASPDAEGGAVYSGRIFWKNYGQTTYPASSAFEYRKCWYIYSGPYSCYSSVMASKSSSTSIDGYRLLGTFTSLGRSQALK